MKMQQRNIEWKVTERLRRPYYFMAESVFRKALIDQLGPVISGVRSGMDYNDAIEMLQTGRVQDAFRYVYGDVGTAFAKGTFAQFAAQQAEAMEHVFRQFMNDFVDQNTGARVTTITNTSKETARSIIKRVVAENMDEGADKLGMAIEKALKKEGARISGWRARVIARTEVATASNYGKQLGAETVGQPMLKRWLSTMDNRTRDVHFSMNGETVPMDGYFNVGGDLMRMPGDMNASPANVINCRCTTTYEVI